MQDHKEIKSFDEIFNELRDLGETDRIEAREYTSTLGSSFFETVSAFSNEQGLGGGYILIGLSRSDYGGKYSVSGVSNIDELQLQI